jgi:hypothetical protein
MSPIIHVAWTQSTFARRLKHVVKSPEQVFAWFSLFLIFILPCFLWCSLLAFASCNGSANDAPVTSAVARTTTIAKVVWFTFHSDNLWYIWNALQWVLRNIYGNLAMIQVSAFYYMKCPRQLATRFASQQVLSKNVGGFAVMTLLVTISASNLRQICLNILISFHIRRINNSISWYYEN